MNAKGFVLLGWVLMAPLIPGAAQPIFSAHDLVHPVTGLNGMVATQEAHASRAAIEVLRAGGNAVDAAVTAGFALAVTLPRAGNLAGGGFMLVHHANPEKTIAIDYREVAPLKAHRDLFLNSSGQVDEEKSRHSHVSAGVPGTVAGLALALERYGTLSLSDALQPAIRLAEEGFRVGDDLAQSLATAKTRFARFKAAMQVFYKPDGSNYQSGEWLRQPDLAESLRGIAREGVDYFYQGPIARAIASDMAAHAGIMTREDLAQYRPVVRNPVEGTYRGHRIISMPPPSSGGVHLIQMLNILEYFPLPDLGHHSAAKLHLLAECAKPAYADRSKHLGDPDFGPVPVDQLISKDYARQLAQAIDLDRATPSSAIAPGLPRPEDRESHETTHFSIIDKDGNAVANTYTLNFSYGSKIMVPGTGILLNNEMDDFAAKPGVPNAYGLLGGERNAIQPRKRMLSSMTPTLILGPEGTKTATGSPGGSRIITTVLQIVSNLIDHQLNAAEATHAPRMHHQWYPDTVFLEHGFSRDTIRLLEQRGHPIRHTAAMGSTQTVLLRDGRFFGASDPRRQGAATLAVD